MRRCPLVLLVTGCFLLATAAGFTSAADRRPNEAARRVEITLPEFGPLTVDVPRAGAFYLVEERGKTVKPLRVP